MNRTSLGATRVASQLIPIFDRSRSRLRIPSTILSEALQQVSGTRLATPVAVVRMESGGIMANGALDPLVDAMLRVIEGASLSVSVQVTAHGDSSLTTMYATPQRAVIASSLDPDLVDISPVRIPRMPETLSDIILLRPPESTGERPIEVPSEVMAQAEKLKSHPDKARDAFRSAGLGDGDVEVLIAIQNPGSRQWRITSTWSVDDNAVDAAELRGVDAGPAGQWLLSGRLDEERGRYHLQPQGDGELLRALRGALPKYWVGRPLGVANSL